MESRFCGTGNRDLNIIKLNTSLVVWARPARASGSAAESVGFIPGMALAS